MEKIRPTKEEYQKRDRIFAKVKRVVEEELEKEKVKGEVTLQGSAAKETWLRGNLELDVFILFPPKSKEWLKVVALKILEKAAKRLGEYIIKYAEHPYINLKVEGVDVDLVPAFKVSSGSEAITAVDRTPFHTKWVKEKLDELGPSSRDEVRLLKAFFKGIGVYGAEVKVEGFSGYMTELLLIHYKGFAETINSMSVWKPPVFLDPGGHDNKPFYLKKFKAPIIVPDPVDPKRNAAAAVSLQSMALASLAAWRYLTNPNPKFYRRPPPPEVKAKRPTYLVELRIVGDHPPETVWGELKRVARSLIKALEREGFQITRYQCWSDEERRACVAIESLNSKLTDEEVRIGPPVWDKGNLSNFLTVHDAPAAGPWIRGDRIMVIEEREEKGLEEVASRYLKNLKTVSLDTKNVIVNRIIEPQEEWLKWFVYGRYWWWS
ncbi:transglycosylase [Ignicoccus pacificus DSM 13166]|uniref:CCA-adding enzyme n=1 Tax=Ignicoccus pacificus DSM 13166 TaxID=940294 RepID=A0A977PL07_9CREN|nr:transglycosylase [Ignicoccus pacificus DSM 13166]